jgi:hypothetical protein
MTALLFDILLQFISATDDRIFSRSMVAALNDSPDRPWSAMRNGKEISELWLSQQLRPYGIRPRTIRDGEMTAKGYTKEDFTEVFQRYIPRSEVEAYFAALREPEPHPDPSATPISQTTLQ